jgi:hypothetical protein
MQFLIKKGLNEEEIDWVMKEAEARGGVATRDGGGVASPRSSLIVPVETSHYSWRQLIVGGVMFGGIVSGAFYWIIRIAMEWMAANRRDEERVRREMEEAVLEIRTNMETAVRELTESNQAIKMLLERQQVKIDGLSSQCPSVNSITAITSELATLKGLLLNRHQFPTPHKGTSTIPSWQKAETTDDDDITMQQSDND